MTDRQAAGPVSHGDLVPATEMASALTAGELEYDDGATQTFDADGSTTYVDGGRPTYGEWSALGDGRFGSFWPPAYRASYELRWIVRDGTTVGLSFREESGRRFDAFYR